MTSPATTESTTHRKVFVIGATGGVGRRLVAALSAAGHPVTGLHHSPGDADTVRQAGAQPVRGDIGDDSPGEGFERYMAAKRAADVDLAPTGLDWLIIRPGTLTDDPGTGSVTAGISVAYDNNRVAVENHQRRHPVRAGHQRPGTPVGVLTSRALVDSFGGVPALITAPGV